MRRFAMLAAMLVVACATAETKAPADSASPAPAKAEATAPAASGLQPVTVTFAAANATTAGAVLEDTKYSEQADDAAIEKKAFADGVVTYSGQVGLGKGSAWAGIGLWAPIAADGKTLDATGYKSVTFKVASTAGMLRLRLAGGDEKERAAGCYPVYMQSVTPELAEYTIPLDQFKAEGWCGPKAISVPDTLKSFYGFEIADIAVQKKPITISVASIRLNP